MLRSLLFIPGNAPGMLLKSDFLQADQIIFDLEDSVSQAEKDAARTLVKSFLREMPLKKARASVRINDISTPHWKKDLEAVAPVLDGVIVLPKSERPEDILAVEEHMRGLCEGPIPKIAALIETAAGVERSFEIANCSKNLCALLLGGEDLSLNLGCRRTKESGEISYARYRLLNSAASAQIPAYDTPFTDTDDGEGLQRDCRCARAIGFSGKLAIHPSQVFAINREFSPTPEEIDYAREVLEAIRVSEAQGRGVASLRGKMIDAPIVKRAQRLLSGLDG